MCQNCVFLKAARDVLEREAGFRCGYPSCRVPTIAPSNSSRSGLSQVGSAAHITAASPNGPRYDAQMSHEQRSSHDNGIWLCQTHAKLIDTDVARFPTDLLHRWKRQLRHLNQRAVGLGLDIASQTEMIRLVRSRTLAGASLDYISEWVGDFLAETGATVVWGRELADASRLVLTELVWNDLQHGGATWARLQSRGYTIRVATDGAIFSVDQLLLTDSPRGGHASADVFRTAYRDTHVLRHVPTARHNTHVITDMRGGPGKHNPCSISTSDLDRPHRSALLDRFLGCPEVHVYFPSRTWTLSGGSTQLQALAIPEGSAVVLHGVMPGAMADALIKLNSHLTIRLAGSD